MDEQNMERPRRVRRTDRYKEEPEEIRKTDALPEEETEDAPTEAGDSDELLAALRAKVAKQLSPVQEGTAPETAGEGPEEETETSPEMPAQAQDNRVPPRARQMSADPYGAVSAVSSAAVRRPGVRVPAKSRPAMPPRPGVESLSRQQVGYAPGRMSESMLRQPREDARENAPESAPDRVRENIRDRVRESAREAKPASRGSAAEHGARVREYPENRFEKPAAAQAYLEKGKKKKGNTRKLLLILLIVVAVIAGALAAAAFILPEDNTIRQKLASVLPFIGKKAPEPIRTLSFTVSGNQNAIAPTNVTISVVTSKDVVSIRLTDEEGRPLVTTLAQGDNTADSVWILTMHLDEPYEGTVKLQACRKGEEWVDTGDTAIISVRSLSESGDGSGAPTGSLPIAEETETPEPAEEPEELPAVTETEEIPEEPAEEERVTPVPTEITTPTPTPKPTAAPTATPPLTAEADESANPSLITTSQVYVGGKLQKEYNRAAKEVIRMPVADEYTKKPMGVMTFRGDNFRRNAACGTVSGAEGLSVAWTAETGSARGANISYYGVGWTGQAAIVKWSKEVREKSNIYDEKKTVSGLKEVIVAGLDGAIRFLDLSDGKLTRNSIKLTYPMRGTPSIHPSGFPYMNVGQFARKMKVKTGKIGLRQYNLYTQKELALIDGLDGKMHRPFNNVGSFETSSLIDRTSDTVITAGTNGMLYLHALNSDFDYQAGVYKTAATTVVLRTKTKGEKDALTAVESSIAAYDKYVYYADMSGVLRCVDTDTLKTVWAVKTGDAVKAAVALDMPMSRELNLYTANMLENRKTGKVQIRRYDALSGLEAWTTEIGTAKEKNSSAEVGAKASPVIGQNSLRDLVYFTVTGLSDEGAKELGLSGGPKAALIALRKEDGSVAWAYGLGDRSESSPVAVYSSEGEGWLIQCDQGGTITLLEGLTGKVIDTLKLEGQIEASPAVYNDMMVISTTGKGDTYIYGIKIRSGNEDLAVPEDAAKEMPNPGKAEEEPAEEAPAEEEPAEEYDEEPAEEYDEEPGEDAEGIG